MMTKELHQKVSSRIKYLKKLRAKLAKKFGRDSVVVKKELEALAHIPYGIGCQSLMVEMVIGRPGLPAGRLIEIIGHEASAKSTVGYHILAECQRLGGISILVESEETFETSRLKKIGVNVDDLIICQPKSMEEAFQMMAMNVQEIRKEHAGPFVIVFDSIASTPVIAEVEGDYDDETMAAAARFLSKALRKFVHMMAENKVVVVFINQMKTNLDRYSGEKWISYGGKSIKFHSTLRFIVKTRKMDIESKGIEPTGSWIAVANIKNKISTPFRTRRFFLNFKKGIDKYRDCRDFGIEIGIFKPLTKGRFVYKGETIDKKQKNLKKFIKKRWKTVSRCSDFLRERALKNGKLKPYGHEKEK